MFHSLPDTRVENENNNSELKVKYFPNEETAAKIEVNKTL